MHLGKHKPLLTFKTFVKTSSPLKELIEVRFAVQHPFKRRIVAELINHKWWVSIMIEGYTWAPGKKLKIHICGLVMRERTNTKESKKKLSQTISTIVYAMLHLQLIQQSEPCNYQLAVAHIAMNYQIKPTPTELKKKYFMPDEDHGFRWIANSLDLMRDE